MTFQMSVFIQSICECNVDSYKHSRASFPLLLFWSVLGKIRLRDDYTLDMDVPQSSVM